MSGPTGVAFTLPQIRGGLAPWVREHAWWLGLGAAALIFAQLPVLLAACCAPAGLGGLGTFWFVNDFSQYESAMRQGATSHSWLVFDRFTPERHAPAFMFTAYVALGKLAALAGTEPFAFYRPAEALSRIVLVWGIVRFLSRVPFLASERVLATALLIFGMGIGLFAAIVGAVAGFDAYTGNGSYEVNTFGLLFSAPHAAAAMGISLAVLAAFLSGEPEARPAELVALFLAGALLSLLHPFHLPALLLGLALWAVRAAFGARVFGPALGVAALTLGAVPVLLYDLATFAADPFWVSTYSRQNLLPSPLPAMEVLVDFGVLPLLAAVGAAVMWRRGGGWVLVIMCLAALAAASYAPVPYQRRLGFGVQPLMAALAGPGIVWLLAHARTPGIFGETLLRALVFVAAFSTTATVFGGVVTSAVGQQPLNPYRADRDTLAATRYLAVRVCDEDLVLAGWDTMNFLAGQTSARVAGGHPVATVDAVARKEAFLAAEHEPYRWAELIERFRPSYLVFGSREIGAPVPFGARQVFNEGATAVYRVGESRCE